MYLLPGTPLFRVPDELPDQVAVLTEPMAVTHGFDRARRLNDTFAETVVVYGVGPLGMCHLIKARLMGAGRLFAIDRFAVATGARGRVRGDRRVRTPPSSPVRSWSPGCARPPAGAGPTSCWTAAACPRRS